MLRPKHLAIELSKLQQHPQHSVELEQYSTEGDLASFFVLAIDQLDLLEGKTVVDIGAGNGVLGLGCAMIGASNVVLVEGDQAVVTVANENSLKVMNKHNCSIETVQCMVGKEAAPEYLEVDIVVMNPPWGFQSPRADRPLLEYGFSLQPKSMYVLHSQQAGHLKAIAKTHGYDWEVVFESNFRLPPKYSHQSRKMGETQIKCWRFHLPGDAKIIDEDE
ncbi:MAG: methyltransferase [Candidatus Poseidoniaceae archaeon]|nr:methyltransferase [Candidatus Poseidoniaceae archaeon]MBL6896642.1 methyltransferase [Candidatus Poseidoniaceae archaeon]